MTKAKNNFAQIVFAITAIVVVVVVFVTIAFAVYTLATLRDIPDPPEVAVNPERICARITEELPYKPTTGKTPLYEHFWKQYNGTH